MRYDVVFDQVTYPVIFSLFMMKKPPTAGQPTPSLDSHSDLGPTRRQPHGQEKARRAPRLTVLPARSFQRKCWRPCAHQTGRGGTWWSACLTPAVNGAAVRVKSARYVKGKCLSSFFFLVKESDGIPSLNLLPCVRFVGSIYLCYRQILAMIIPAMFLLSNSNENKVLLAIELSVLWFLLESVTLYLYSPHIESGMTVIPCKNKCVNKYFNHTIPTPMVFIKI